MRTFRFPSILRRGDEVDVIAPASPFERAPFDAGLEVLAAMGLCPRLGAHLEERVGYLAASDGARLEDLRAALARRGPAIFSARGGYGAMRLLGTIDADARASEEPLLVGFSDITALHGLWQTLGRGSLHAPVVTSLARVGPRSRELLTRVLFDPRPLGELALPCPVALRGGVAGGPLLGGNLSVLTRLLGTPYLPSLDGAVLFLEDVGERPYRIDRMLTHLHLTGALRGVAAILLGDFTRCEEPGAALGDPSALDVLREGLAPLGVPVLAGMPAGHGAECWPLLLGGRVVVDATGGRVVFEDGLSPR